MCVSCFLVYWLAAFVDVLAAALVICVFARVLLSWVPGVRLPLGLGELVWNVSEPILGPIRRALPFMGGLDFSPIVAFILIRLVQGILHQVLLTLPVGL